jgi:PAS domain-containing protein
VTRIEQPAGVPDAAEVLRSIDEAAYEWRLDTDALLWSGNAASLLGRDIASGRSFAQKVDAKDGQSRHDAVNQAAQSDAGEGVPYQVQYVFRHDDEKIWLEDTGRWFAGADGKPLRALGTVRAINARHAREAELLRLAKFDPLTGEMNRLHLT